MRIYSELQDRVVLVTGGTQGIGEAMADAYAKQQCRLAINGRVLNEKVRKVADRTGALPVMGDLGEPGVGRRIVDETIARFGGIDVLVCNAALQHSEFFLKHDRTMWQKHIDINVRGHFECLQAALPHMVKQKRGAIVIISSYFGTLGWEKNSGYGASKTGVLTMGQYISRQFKDDGITVGIIVPGVIKTPQLQADADSLGLTYEEACDYYAEMLPIKRLGKSADIATMAVFMSTSEGGRAFNGRHLQISGGDSRVTPYYI